MTCQKVLCEWYSQWKEQSSFRRASENTPDLYGLSDIQICFLNTIHRTLLAVWRWRLCASNAGDLGLIPGQGTKGTSQVSQQWRAHLLMQGISEMQVQSPGREDPLEEEATHSRTLARKIPWTEEPGGLQTMGLQTVRHVWVCACTHTHKHTEQWSHMLHGATTTENTYTAHNFICISLIIIFLVRKAIYVYYKRVRKCCLSVRRK